VPYQAVSKNYCSYIYAALVLTLSLQETTKLL
jgi:hypothetical protein